MGADREGTGVARSFGVSLTDAYPQVAATWLQERNGGLTPEKATPKMQVAVSWRCAAGHEWQETSDRLWKGLVLSVTRSV